MKILITGATGSLGSYLTRYFSLKGHEIIASGKISDPPSGLKEYAKYVCADIRNELQFPDADVCIHTAALSDDKATLKDLYKPNVQGTQNVLEASGSFKKFIHISSSSVYLPSDTPLKEDIAGRQNNKLLSPYGSSKLQAEEIVHQYCRNSSCFILRPRALYGPGDKVILPRLLKLEKDGKLLLPGGLNVNVSLTHYRNFAQAVDLCLHSGLKGIHTYNVADKTQYLLIDVLRTLCSGLLEKTLPEKHIPVGVLRLMALFKLGGISKLLIRSFTKDMVLNSDKFIKDHNYIPDTNLYDSFETLKDWVNSIGGYETIKTADKKLAWEHPEIL